ncbi:PspC domain-containing protein [Paenibacillus doosanensis]|uniref:PspC domain protein n=1 Tax=Paenibacillus konkukensis TaxID=2020716 RepID=A0ABY4RN65_9BACL|nr:MULTISPECIES: PspC domain-containing protein [Paenibacillus]MCS7461773.1 PspC domain-containing protein [Paenibacillus doosanensis]UQZ83613.1 PspC domain protein [Paenibacillus konkukensis]
MTRIYRSRTDRKVAGLCGGLSDTLGIDSNILRLIVVVTTFFSAGVVIPLYFLATLVIPTEPYPDGTYGPRGYGGAGRWNGGEAEWGGRFDGSRRHHGRDRGRHHGQEGHYDQAGSGYQGGQAQGQQAGSNLDDMMKDIEKKAMWKEIEELRAKVANYEKQQQSKGDV